MGHDVSVMAQDSEVSDLDFVNEFIRKGDRVSKQENSFDGYCKVYQPEIGDLLPCYVDYESDEYRTKPFTQLTGAELRNYIEKNVEALRWIQEEDEFRHLITNHVVMSPYIAYKLNMSDLSYYSVVHGSSIAFTVKQGIDRYSEYALKGLNHASRIIVPSEYIMSELKRVLGSELEADKIKLIPLGTNVESFQIPKNKKRYLKEAKKELIRLKNNKGSRAKDINQKIYQEITNTDDPDLEKIIGNYSGSYTKMVPDSDTDEISKLDMENDFVITYLGKILNTKGVFKLVIPILKILKKYPEAKFMVIGFGGHREPFELLFHAVTSGNKDLYEKIIRTYDDWDKEHKENLDDLEFLEGSNYSDRVVFTGYADHQALKYLLPLSDVMVAPSKTPEAFALVSVEAMSSGVIPMVTNFSGFKDFIKTMETEIDKNNLPDFLENTIKLNPNKRTTKQIENNLENLIKHKEKIKSYKNRKKLHRIAKNHYSWKMVTNSIMETIKENKENPKT